MLVLCVVWEKVAAQPGVGFVQSVREGYNGLIRRGGQYYLPAALANTESAAVYSVLCTDPSH